jgi:hypothetical protein
MYNQLASTNTSQAQSAADMVDIEATLTVLVPDFIKDLKSNSFEELGIKDYAEIRSLYIEQILPWWNEMLKQVGLVK